MVETSFQSIPERRAPLDAFFHPRNVAVIGATEDLTGVGRSLVTNLKQTSFGGAVHPVNPKRSDVLRLPCYASVQEIPEQIDLAVLATPARTASGIVRECVEGGSLLEIARFEKLDQVTAEILTENRQMLEVCRLLGFDFEHVEDGVVHGVLAL
jgi:acetyltransferase